MKLREAIFSDWKILLEWRNDPLTRKNSFTQEVVQEEKHKLWFKTVLLSEEKKIFILENESCEPLGTIRSDKIDSESYLLSWTISPHFRKKGYGNLILNLFLQNRRGIFTAEIKPENIYSIKMALKNGFKKINKITYRKKL